MGSLAINGVAPVRNLPFPTNYLGVALYDGQEQDQPAGAAHTRIVNI